MYEHGFSCTSWPSPDVDLEPVTVSTSGAILSSKNRSVFQPVELGPKGRVDSRLDTENGGQTEAPCGTRHLLKSVRMMVLN